jgi:AcrR family transcriptional regulator
MDGSTNRGRIAKAREPARVRLSERHQRLLAELEVIFLAEGFRQLTIDKLAERLKCSKRTIYEIAPTKQELFLVVVERWLAQVRHEGNLGAFQHDDPEKRIAAYMEPGYSGSTRASGPFIEDIQSFRPALILLQAHQRERMNVLRDIVEEGIQRGRFRSLHAGLVAGIYLAAIAKINEPEFLRPFDMHFSGALEELFQLMAFGLFKRRDDSEVHVRQIGPSGKKTKLAKTIARSSS